MPLHTQETTQKRAICVQFGEKNSGGGHVSSFKRGGGISKGGHVSSFEKGGQLAWEVHWHGGGGVGMGTESCTQRLSKHYFGGQCPWKRHC